MDSSNDRDQIVRRIVLPSGKTIEVVRAADRADRPGDDSSATRAAANWSAGALGDGTDTTPSAATDPQLCPGCHSELVYPVAWTAAGADRWRVELRCPNCERTASALLDAEVAERFDEELERGAETLMGDLARLSEANMLEDLERFAAALRADAILPVDF